MSDFELTLGYRKYKVTSTSSSREGQSWDLSFDHGGIWVSVRIPIEKRLTRAKVMLFVEALHEGLNAAFISQDISQDYAMNQKHSIR